ncbi:MAG: hypothetical protein ABIH37_00865 [archaeon]
MKKITFVFLSLFLLISLTSFVLADDTNQSIKCYSNGDCGVTTPGYKFSCQGNWLCSDSYETPFCENPGTINSSCKTITSSGTCQLCPNGCKDGSCIQINNIKCYKNEDCGSGTSTAFCSGNSACSTSTTPTCLNPGTSESQCSSVSTTGCSSPCKYGCKNGACIKNEQCTTDADCPSLCPTCGIGVACPCTKYICNNGECVPETITTCVEGSTKKYTCQDGTQVDWCTCSNGNWACVNSPEIKCKTEIDAYLNQKFELKMQQSAVIKDYKDMKVKYVASSTCSCPTCGVGVPCPCPPCELKIKIQVEMPSGGNTGTGTEFDLAVGEKKKVFDVTVSLIDLNKGIAVLLVSKDSCPISCICTDDTVSCPACQEGYIYNPKTQKCEPSVYNCPEGCVCTDSTTSCPSNTTLKYNGYRFAYWQCYDGTENKAGDGNSCYSSQDFNKKANEDCKEHCNKDSGKCGVNSFSVSQDCSIEEFPTTETGTGSGGSGHGNIDVENTLFCKNSCPLDNKCYPFGYRKDNNFCSDEGKFIEQLKGDKTCENNFECSSNLCVDSKCVSQGLFQKIIDWFSKLFGGK